MTPPKTNKFTFRLLPSALLFCILCILVIIFPIFKIDLFISRELQTIQSPLFTNIMILISWMGNRPQMDILVGATFIILFLSGLRREAVVSLVSTTLAVASGSLIKMIINRNRPSTEYVDVHVLLRDKSFPSNHTLAFTVFFGFLLYLILSKAKGNRRLFMGTITAILIAVISFSRVYLGAHWATDTLGGYLLGIIWLEVAINYYHKLNRSKTKDER